MPGVLPPHEQHFQEGLADIAKFVRCEQEAVVNVRDFCKTQFKCGMTIVPMPDGMVRTLQVVVKTEDGADYCDPVVYRETDYHEVECLGRRSMVWANITPSVSGSLPLGVLEADASTDAKCGRARTGVWAKYRGKIYIAPWIQSVEQVLIEWDGIKTLWADGDPVNEEQDYKLAVQLYCQYAHHRDYGSPEKAFFYKRGSDGMWGYDRALAELAWTCEQKLKVRETAVCRTCMPGRLWFGGSSHFQSGIAPTVTDTIIAHVGNIGVGTNDVSDLVDGLSPVAVVNSGNNDVLSANYDLAVGQDYHQYLSPYYGAYGDGAEKNALWPAFGSGDIESDWLAFFPTPGNQTHYDVCIYPVHFFFVDSTDDLVDNSAQANWLQAKLTLSPAPWKVVVLNGNPYGSNDFSPALRLAYKSWGANLVLSAGSELYERLSVNGLPYIINGAGGSALAAASAPIATSLFQSSQLGVGKITANATELTYEFIAEDGGIVDTLELTK